jgi:hypothetical protein
MAPLIQIPYHWIIESLKLDCERSDPLMLDHPEKTARLLAALKAAVPFEVELAPSLVNNLRAQHVVIADQSQHVVSDLSYAGDEGGIVCHIAPRRMKRRSSSRLLMCECPAHSPSRRLCSIIRNIE